MRPRDRVTLTVVLLLAGASPRAWAQDVRLEADGGLSRALSRSGPLAESATYLVAGLRLSADRADAPGRLFANLYGGLGLQGAGGDWVSLTAGAGWRQALGSRLGLDVPFTMTAEAAGDPTWYRALSVEAGPELSYPVGRATLLLRGRAAAGGSKLRGVLPGRGSPPVRGPIDAAGSHLWLVGGGPGLRVPVGQGIEVTGRAEVLDAASGTFGYGSAELTGRPDPVGWSAGIAVWGTPAGARASGSITISIPLGGGWSLLGSGGRSEPDPLEGSPPAAFATGLVSRALVRRGAAAPAELYRVVRRGVRPTVRITVRARGARHVALVGDFNRWTPLAMRRRDGTWTIEFRVAPGTYHFGFLVDGTWFLPPDAPGRVSDAFGRDNATLVVPP